MTQLDLFAKPYHALIVYRFARTFSELRTQTIRFDTLENMRDYAEYKLERDRQRQIAYIVLAEKQPDGKPVIVEQLNQEYGHG